MQEKFKGKDIYLYPSGEDAQAVSIILEHFRETFSFGKIIFLDDAKGETSLLAHKDMILNRGILWIVHQDLKLCRILFENAEILPKRLVYDGITELQTFLLAFLNNAIVSNVIEAHSKRDYKSLMDLNYFGYFVLQFWLTLQEDVVFVEILREFTQKLSVAFQEIFKIPKHSVGVVVTSFSGNRHLGEIGILLEKMGVNVVYVCYNEESLKWIPSAFSSDSKAIIFPLQCSYLGKLLSVFEIFVTCQMPLTSPQWGTKMIYVPHAYIDPIATLVQRKRALDEEWFRRKMGIGGYRILSSLSNYQIYKDKFQECGYEEELVCGGYPSLDSGIQEYEQYRLKTNICGGGGILIAMNDVKNLSIVENLLVVRKRGGFKNKVYFRPHPGSIIKEESQKLADKFAKESWFVYDNTNRMSAEVMADCCCLVGDYSSLVYTFPLTTLKPAILVFQDKELLKNSYSHVFFYHPILHKVASNVQEILEKLEEIFQENKKDRANKIQAYRKKEVFNLGKSSEFIANFIFKILKKD